MIGYRDPGLCILVFAWITSTLSSIIPYVNLQINHYSRMKPIKGHCPCRYSWKSNNISAAYIGANGINWAKWEHMLRC